MNTMKTISSYEQQAINFLAKTKISFSVEWVRYGYYFHNDKNSRHIFRVSLKKEGVRKKSFLFGQSIAKGATPPTAYDVLACLQKYDVGTFDDFCGEFGYDADSRKTYKAVVKEHNMVCALWNEDELSELQEIQ